MSLVGRDWEQQAMAACLSVGRHVLLEGPVGVGKTVLARTVCDGLGRGFVRVDGDGRYTEAKLVGQFDPPRVLAEGYVPDAFIDGPLLRAMKQGAVLFINELNRMPEGVQNVLLPVLDEGFLNMPHVGVVRAAQGFSVIATQNPAEFVAAGALSEALLDRFELLRLGYADADEERVIVANLTRAPHELVDEAVRVVRATRSDPRFRRGASVRAAIAIAELAVALGDADISRAALMALPTRIELADPLARLGPILEDLRKKALGAPAPN